MAPEPPIYAAKTHDELHHLDEEQGCNEYSEDDVSEYFMVDLYAIVNEPAPYCEQGQWCSECYRNLLALASQHGDIDGPNQ